MSSKVHIGARIEPELHEAITGSAQEKGITLSEEVNRLLNQGLVGRERSDLPLALEEQELTILHPHFPEVWIQELLYMVNDEYEAWDGIPSVEEFIEDLAERVEESVEQEAEENYPSARLSDLPEEFVEVLEQTWNGLIQLADEIDDREVFLLQWASLLEEAIAEDDDTTSEQEIVLRFDEATRDQLRELLSVRNRKQGGQNDDAALTQLIYQLLGEALQQGAGPLFFGGYEREEMGRVGEILKSII
jgi:type II secretory ATPase GspE/PulE/Tfp pilus assembly ATPase PilB-like protein